MMNSRRRRGGHSLIEILGVIVVLAVLGGLATMWYTGAGKGGKNTVADRVKTPTGSARRAACQNNISQLVMSVRTRAVSEEEPLTNLSDLQRHGVPAEMLRCPETGMAYQYNPATGLLSCPTPGHESLAVNLKTGS